MDKANLGFLFQKLFKNFIQFGLWKGDDNTTATPPTPKNIPINKQNKPTTKPYNVRVYDRLTRTVNLKKKKLTNEDLDRLVRKQQDTLSKDKKGFLISALPNSKTDNTLSLFNNYMIMENAKFPVFGNFETFYSTDNLEFLTKIHTTKPTRNPTIKHFKMTKSRCEAKYYNKKYCTCPRCYKKTIFRLANFSKFNYYYKRDPFFTRYLNDCMNICAQRASKELLEWWEQKHSYSTAYSSSVQNSGMLSQAYVSYIRDGFIYVSNTRDQAFAAQRTVAIYLRGSSKYVLGSVVDFNEFFLRVFAFEGFEDVSVFDTVHLLSDLMAPMISEQTDSLKLKVSLLSSKMFEKTRDGVLPTFEFFDNYEPDEYTADQLEPNTEFLTSHVYAEEDLTSRKHNKVMGTYDIMSDSQPLLKTFSDTCTNNDLFDKTTSLKTQPTWAAKKIFNKADLDESLCLRVSNSMLGSVITSTGNVLVKPNTFKSWLLSNPESVNTENDKGFENFIPKNLSVDLLEKNISDVCSNPDTFLYSTLEWKPIRYNTSKFFYKSFKNSEAKAPTVMNRKKVIDPLNTGITLVDLLLPIGKGQRQLIIGDRQTGKTTIALDSIINQTKRSTLRGVFGFSPTISVYVSIGQRQSEVYNILESLNAANSMENTVIISSPSNSPSSYQFLSAYTGTAIAEYFRDSGRNVVVIYDDLSKHAVAYRQLSLLLRRSPSRESYPSDIFYVHARLLERSSFLRSGGSLTALPVVETLSNDVSAFIPTNVISITDGQLFLESSLFLKGNKPAIGIGFSVSRIGASAQNNVFKAIAPLIRSNLSKYRAVEALKSFSDDLDAYTLRAILRGERTWDIMKQAPKTPYDLVCQGVLSYCSVFGLLDDLNSSQVEDFKNAIIFDASSGILDLVSYGYLGDEMAKNTYSIYAPSSKTKIYATSVLTCLQELVKDTNSTVFTNPRSSKHTIESSLKIFGRLRVEYSYDFTYNRLY